MGRCTRFGSALIPTAPATVMSPQADPALRATWTRSGDTSSAWYLGLGAWSVVRGPGPQTGWTKDQERTRDQGLWTDRGPRTDQALRPKYEGPDSSLQDGEERPAVLVDDRVHAFHLTGFYQRVGDWIADVREHEAACRHRIDFGCIELPRTRE